MGIISRGRQVYISYAVDWIIVFIFLTAFLLIEYVATPNNHQSWGMLKN